MIDIKVKWTGVYPNLCSGEWIFTVNGKELEVSEELKRCDLNTKGTYQQWHFEDWSEVWESYQDGLKFEDWIESGEAKKVFKFLEENQVNLDLVDKEDLYLKISKEDWRHMSCGGCI